jgi:hypothetical protein
LARLAAAGLLIARVGRVDARGTAADNLCPIVKWIGTPSWAIFSAGVVAEVLVIFYAIIERRGWRRRCSRLPSR